MSCVSSTSETEPFKCQRVKSWLLLGSVWSCGLSSFLMVILIGRCPNKILTSARTEFLNAVYFRQGLTCTLGLTKNLVDGGQPRAKPHLGKVKPRNPTTTTTTPRNSTYCLQIPTSPSLPPHSSTPFHLWPHFKQVTLHLSIRLFLYVKKVVKES